MNKKFISWRRVSTTKQSKSGLGMEAQKEIIRFFVEREKGELVQDYSECYTGTELSGCVELKKAMKHAKEIGATLVIAKTDRFRNTIEALQVYEEMGEGNIMFCDLPHTDKFTLTLFFALAEREALIVSIRTKQALKAKRERGEKTGGASDKWKKSRAKKTKSELQKEKDARSSSRVVNNMESKDMQVTMQVLKKVFGFNDDMETWDLSKITTFGVKKLQVLSTMKDFQTIDENLFKKWDLSDIYRNKLHRQLASYLQSVKKTITLYCSIKQKKSN